MNLTLKKGIINLKNTTLYILDSSNYYILISDFPLYLGYGHNSFLLSAKQEFFEHNTFLMVSLSDALDNPIPVLITLYVLRGFVRCSINIEEGSCPAGFGTLILVGVLLNSINGKIPEGWRGKNNVKHQRRIYINSYYKTISKLRFKLPPRYDIRLNQKLAYSFKIMNFSLTLKIKDIRVLPKKKLMFMLQVLPLDINTSMFHEKLLNYTITDNFLAYTNPKCIFRGEVLDLLEIPTGSYNGLLTALLVDKSLNIKDFDITVKRGRILITNTLDFKLIDCLNISETVLSVESDISGGHILLVRIVGVENFEIDDSDSNLRIIPYRHLINVLAATNLFMLTKYFKGSKLDGVGSIYSLIFMPHEDVKGLILPKDIHDPDKAEEIDMSPNLTYRYVTITDPCSFLGNLYLNLNGVNVKDCIFSNLLNSIALFDSFSGSFYSKTLLTQSDNQYSYIDGIIVGLGHITSLDGGTIYRNYLLTQGLKVLQAKAGDKYKLGIYDVFLGTAYNVDIDASYFIGDIYHGRLVLKTLETPYDFFLGNTLLTALEDFEIKIGYIKSHFDSAKTLKIKNRNISEKRPISFSIEVKEGLAKLDGSSCTLSNQLYLYKLFLDIKGVFAVELTVSSLPTNSSFKGFYQNKQDTSGITKILIYDILLGNLSMKHFDYFKTKSIVYDQSKPDILYIPNSIFKGSVLIDQIYRHFYDLQHLDYRIDLDFKIRDLLSKGDLLVNKGQVPLLIKILLNLIYSGFWQGIKVIYNSIDGTSGTKNSQLLTLILIKDHAFPTICNVNIPIDIFASGSSFYLEFIPYNAVGDLAPEDFIYKMYDFLIDLLFILGINSYKITQGDIDNIEFPVKSVNQKRGHVILKAEDVLTSSQLLNVNRKITISNSPPCTDPGCCNLGDIWIIPL